MMLSRQLQMRLKRVETVEHHQVLLVLAETVLCSALGLVVPEEADALLVEMEPIRHAKQGKHFTIVLRQVLLRAHEHHFIVKLTVVCLELTAGYLCVEITRQVAHYRYK